MIWLWSEKAKLKKKKIGNTFWHALQCQQHDHLGVQRQKWTTQLWLRPANITRSNQVIIFLKLTKSISKCKQIDRFDEFLKLFF